jgi:hypothetical protein
MVLADLREAYVQRVKIRIVLGIIVLFLVSMVMSCQELRYMVSGKTVDAKLELSQVEKSRSRAGNEVKKRVLAYSFFDGDKFRREYADVPLNWSNGESPTVKVQYLPGKERFSRVEGQRNLVWVAIFFTSLAVAAVGIFMIAREK